MAFCFESVEKKSALDWLILPLNCFWLISFRDPGQGIITSFLLCNVFSFSLSPDSWPPERVTTLQMEARLSAYTPILEIYWTPFAHNSMATILTLSDFVYCDLSLTKLEPWWFSFWSWTWPGSPFYEFSMPYYFLPFPLPPAPVFYQVFYFLKIMA